MHRHQSLWTNGTLTGWTTRTAEGEEIRSRYLVLGVGRDARIPEQLRPLAQDRVIHSTQYLQRISQLRKDLPYRVAVIGGGQSAAELFCAVQSDLPECKPTMVMRSIGLNYYETSKFNNELFYPSFVDELLLAAASAYADAQRAAPHQLLRPGAGHDGLALPLGLSRPAQRPRPADEIPTHDITGARDEGDEIVLELTDWRTGAVKELRTDLVLLGTGFSTEMPAKVRHTAESLGSTSA